ncbi:MAG: alpha/beta hydrolase [Candidatus Omnitrophica bacterium]|nr:alpha/beta hydrolase [Candidatus Omnitrophota bacterium]
MQRPENILSSLKMNPKIAITKNGRIEYDITEGSLPVVLSMHGGLGGLDQARVMVSWLDENKYRLLCPSRPGYLGTPLESGKTIEEQADLFAALLDELKIDKVACVAASAGGPPAYMFAIRHPDRVWALVAIDSVSGYYDMPDTAGFFVQLLFLSPLGQKLNKILSDKNPAMFLQQLYQSEAYFTKEQLKKHVDFALKSPGGLDFVKAFMDTMYPYDVRKPGTENDMEQYRKLTHLPVEKIKCPSLVIHGTHDADVKFYDGVYAYEHIPGAERYWIEEGSHLGFWLSPHAQTAQEIAGDFLDRNAKAR